MHHTMSQTSQTTGHRSFHIPKSRIQILENPELWYSGNQNWLFIQVTNFKIKLICSLDLCLFINKKKLDGRELKTAKRKMLLVELTKNPPGNIVIIDWNVYFNATGTAGFCIRECLFLSTLNSLLSFQSNNLFIYLYIAYDSAQNWAIGSKNKCK